MKKLFTLLFVLCGLFASAQIGGSPDPILKSLRVKSLTINHATLPYHLPYSRGTNGKFMGLQGDSTAWLSIPSDTGKVSTLGDYIYGNLSVSGWLKAKSGVFAVGHNLGIANAAETKSVQFALSGSHVGNDTYTLPTAYPIQAGMSFISGTDGTMSFAPRAEVCDIQIFEEGISDWTMPDNARVVQVTCIGAGAGGGSGRRGASGSAITGGAGGAGGAYSEKVFSASVLPSTVSVTVGAGGEGGEGVASDNTNGIDGTEGGTSMFGSYLKAGGGLPGRGGLTTGAAGGQGSEYYLQESGGNGANSTTSDGDKSANTRQAGSAGGPGGGISTGDIPSNGGDGGDTRICATMISGGEGGEVGGTLDGSSGTNTVKGLSYGGPGGGGGASATDSKAGDGADGANYGGGGGGGGASQNGYRSGAGGNGAPGIVIVITYF